ncbi:DUF1990 domain-containing protein [Deinococcus detaillensis]|uniref:DUF1990 domain-containing protein n=1 Tax=Deinococcus detaillensis TaxID=2592048 RepID=A0A553US40_9DEIO|nr:DUF1990 domain-containing protein [Deinococcus detaillensis]TSA83040.1 DUF1990 domain-containing protein [Deinococcus detaillensis]
MQLTRTTPAAFSRVLKRASSLNPTYSRIGVTLDPQTEMEQHTVLLGTGQATFERGKAALQSWQTHQSRWLRLYPGTQPPAEGQTVLVLLTCAGLCLAFGCRVVRVLDGSRQYGFAYGSLPGHPERGEELFVVEWHSDDRVTFSLKADSQPANRFYRLGRPFGQLVRSLGTRQYLNSVRRAAQ